MSATRAFRSSCVAVHRPMHDLFFANDLAKNPAPLALHGLAGPDHAPDKKSPGEAGALNIDDDEKTYFVSRFLSAVPRMSPRVAPESEEPYCAMASFSSATSSALIDTWTLRAFLSNWITRASTFSPTAKRAAR